MTAENPDKAATRAPIATGARVADNPERSRFEIHVDGELAGYAAYRDLAYGRAFTHTVVASQFEGRGLASQLIGFALDEARRTGQHVIPLCPFLRRFVKRHPLYNDLVSDARRFGLDAPISGNQRSETPTHPEVAATTDTDTPSSPCSVVDRTSNAGTP